MEFKKADLVIINRSFWPIYPVIGEALLRLAEKQAEAKDIRVIIQDHADVRTELKNQCRGNGVKFYPCKAWSVSGSSVLRRVADAVFFMIWVFAMLFWSRPKKVYVSTDPPVLVPFIVLIYSKLFNAEYIYHLQDIHPEAANVVIPVNRWLFGVLRWLDSFVMRYASLIITITEEMAQEIRVRSATAAHISVIPNPAISFDGVIMPASKKAGFTFCGNAGRLQRIPLLIDAISAYIEAGGTLPFIFAGGGVFAKVLEQLSNNYTNVTYLGQISAAEAAQLNADYQWALLPIEDGVTRFAFPSKSSSYVFSGSYVAAICGDQTSVASWVRTNDLGVVIEPDVESLCSFFRQVECHEIDDSGFNQQRLELKRRLSFDCFISQLEQLIAAKDVRQ